MSEWTWRQTVAEQVIDIVNATGAESFTIDELYVREPIFCAKFPQNRHVREKIRQSLQKLRDSGFLIFHGGGNYSVNLRFDELIAEPVVDESLHDEAIRTRVVVRSVRLRNTLLAIHMKARYSQRCQVCGQTVPLTNGEYAEAHHLIPLGMPHRGPDIMGNIVVVCPNHHVMFDRGALAIEQDSLTVTHLSGAIPPRPLIILPWHSLRRSCLQYHNQRICGSL